MRACVAGVCVELEACWRFVSHQHNASCVAFSQELNILSRGWYKFVNIADEASQLWDCEVQKAKNPS